MTPTQRSLKLLRERGYFCAVVEKWNAHKKIRQDLFGFADILACKPPSEHVLVQVCGGGGGALAQRIAKIMAEPRATAWLNSGGMILAQQWVRRKPLKGKTRIRIELREKWLTSSECLTTVPRGE